MADHHYTPAFIDVHGSEKSGFLVALESGSGPLPFEIKRIFYIFGVPKGGRRGGHAHRKGQQFFICLAGKAEIICEIIPDKSYYMNVLTPPIGANPLQQKGFFVPAGAWVKITMVKPKTILLCLCSNHYDEGDYIRDRETWEREFSAS